MTQTLFILGSLPFIVLGFAHGVYTLIEERRPFRLTPHKPEVREAMKSSTIAIHPTTNMWRGWLGFNYSHSVGAVAFGLIYFILAQSEFETLAGNPLLLWLPVVVSGSFVLMAWRYWFIIPLVGTALGFVCFAAGTGLVFGG